MKDIDLTGISFTIEVCRAQDVTLTFEVIDKDCDTKIETPRDLTGIVPSLLAYNANSEEIINVTGTISGIDNNIVNIPFTALDLTVYPTTYFYNLLLDTQVFSKGELNVIQNANYKITYPTI